MIGHFLAQLPPAAEDRILTTALVPGTYCRSVEGGRPLERCLVGAAAAMAEGLAMDRIWIHRAQYNRMYGLSLHVTNQYDALCKRFGTTRVNAAIRSRILTNRLWRALMSAPVAEHA
jgi:hypothetical protein